MVREDGLMKYPRTPHLEGSKLQKGDTAHDQIELSQLPDGIVVIEEKMDGANSGVSFSDEGILRLQSRGHFLSGGSRERHFNIFKQWANAHEEVLFDTLTNRYIMFGEWMFAKHSVYYDALPHYFLEFDLFDKEKRIFLSTPRRQEILSDCPIVSVPILSSGKTLKSRDDLDEMIGFSLGRSSCWRKSLSQEAERRGVDLDKVMDQTDQDERTEGVYIKVEDDERVLERYKFIRSSFTQSILDQGDHWQSRPIIPNDLRGGVDIFSPTVDKAWPQMRGDSLNKKRRHPSR